MEARSECMLWRSLWGEIFPLRGAVLRSLIFEKCCDARQEYSRATTAATGGKKKKKEKKDPTTDIQVLHTATPRRAQRRQQEEISLFRWMNVIFTT